MPTDRRRYFPHYFSILMLCVTGCALDKNIENAGDEPRAALRGAASAEASNQAAELAAEQAREAQQQQIALADAVKKCSALSDRVRELQGGLEEKDAALQQASHELKAANAEIAQTREELQRWKQETTSLRERLRQSEEETLGTLQSVVPALERMGTNK